MRLARAGFSRAISAGPTVLKSAIHKISRVLLDPSEKLVELPHMLNLWFRCVALQRTDKDDNIQASVREIGNSPKQRHVELVQLRATKILSL